MICTEKYCVKFVKDANCYQLVDSPYKFSIHDTINDIEEIWSTYRSQHNLFLSCDYFKALEACPPDDLQCKYIMLHEDNLLVAMLPVQLKLFQAKESILDIQNESSGHLRKKVAEHVKFNSLISGNITVSGEYMYCFVAGDHSPQERFELTEEVLGLYREILSDQGHKVNMTLLKDVPEQRNLKNINCKNSQFKDFEVEPLMVLYLDKEWETMNDYLSSMSSKYRVRAKRAFKKSKDISYRELEYQEIHDKREVFYQLYENVLNNVNFSLFKLPLNYFATMKKHLGENFRFFVAETSSGDICAFYTMIHNDVELHAHYLGYDKDVNRECQVYLNLLYKMVELGIDHKHEHIDFGRTALEIKSSVGAKAYNYSLYLKHKNSLANIFVPSIISILNKKTSWTPRNPFKD